PTLAWKHDLAGRGTPTIAGTPTDERVFALGYEGSGAEVTEVLVAIDAEGGQRLWTRRYPDFLSDIIYERYSIGSPTVDGATGHVYAMTSPGLLVAVTRDGEPLWERSMMEEFGRLTFPNGRTGAPVLVGEVVVVHGISTSWGALGPGRDRLFAFDRTTGDLAWVSTPGTPPKDSSFSTPVVGTHDGRQVLYVGTGCGHLACVSAHDGAPLWRFKLSHGGVNATPLVLGDRVVAIHGKENIDSSQLGRMVAIAPGPATAQGGKPTTLGAEHEVWRAELVSFTSSPVHHGGVVYQTTAEGNLVAVDAATGAVLWRHRLGRAQLHASPLMVDDPAAGATLYVPMQEGTLHVLRPTREGPHPVSVVQLEGSCIGAPATWGGKLYVHTTEALYAFGGGDRGAPTAPAPQPTAVATAPVALRLLPGEVLARPGETIPRRVQPVDDHGRAAGDARAIAPLVIPPDAAPRAGVETVTEGGLEGPMRVRIVPGERYDADFEDITLGPHPRAEGVSFAHPPAWWSGAKLKWEVRALDGGKVLVKTLARVLFQRATSFFGHPQARGYTLGASVRSDGNRRGMGVVGVVNQRYVIALDGNRRELTVHSNHDRFRHAVPFVWSPGAWIRLETRVDVGPDGGGIIRAKAWPRGEPEPEAWTLEAAHAEAHTHGAPGLFGFSPQAQHRVYIDDVRMAPAGPLVEVTP
ncbi:MAG: PQQ-binding-like beta-propeller repeat protein, partial [Myxococcota bacterium]|nr:PQQ-binding-like beta-propeller repeat protein [Myxococcota bacterium]